MQEVQPIRNQKQIKAMELYLKEKNAKYSMMFRLGINSGLRISDILKLTVADMVAEDSQIKEKKTGKRRYLFLENEKLKREIAEYIKEQELSEEDYLIYSRKHDADGNQKPISRVQAYRVLEEAAEACGVANVGTHTLRKTFGYWHYKQFHDVAFLQKLFNHSAPSITLRYIGYEKEQMADAMKNFYL